MVESVIKEYSRPDAWQIEKFPDFYAYQHEESIIFSEIRNFDFRKALDIGCGRGRFCIPLAKENKTKQITAVDVTPFMIETVTRQADNLGLDNLTCRLFDAQQMVFEKGYFDLVICVQILGNIKEPETFFNRVSSFIANGGKIVISTGNTVSLYEILDRLIWRFRRGVNISSPDISLNCRGFWRISYWDLKRILRNNGFKIIKVYGAGLLSYHRFIPPFIGRVVEKLSEVAPFCFFSHFIIVSAIKVD